ncbi:DUF1640 domain-containing protein [Methylobacter sp.]|jgi:hypothetical protein|uniref:DUF1640 domain-containing protein n=1 Tax=Methylobacter sp. TaxID=2051955 RepID=UPI002FDCEBD2
MSTITFDTHEFFNELKSAGFSDQQAEVITRLQKAAVASTLEQTRADYELDEIASKRDLRELELSIKHDLVKWIAGMMLAQAGIIAALVKLL